MAPPAGVSLATRLQLGPESTGEAQGINLELVSWPLYSCAAFDAAALPRETELFNYTVGQVVSGAGTGAIAATQFHTNMLAVRTIPRPKTFTVFAIRMFSPPVEYSTAPAIDDTTGAALENDDHVDDVTLIHGTMSARFEIGEKTYAEAPLWMMPANVKVAGAAATSVSNTNAASVYQRRNVLSTCGLAYHFKTARKPVLWNQQNLRFWLLCQWATNPSLTGQRLLFAVLDGIMGREIQ